MKLSGDTHEAATRIGLLILGRKRPGFDPEWGALVRKRIGAFLDDAGYHTVVPSENVADDADLRKALAACEQEGVRALLVVQPTISDGRLAPVLSQVWGRPIILWATPEKQTGEMISANSLVGTHAMAATLRHLHRPFHFVWGDPDDRSVREEIDAAVRLCRAYDAVTEAKVGLVGSHAPGFIDFHADPVSLNDTFGLQLYHQGVQDFVDRVNAQAADAVAADAAEFEKLGLPLRGVEREDLLVQSRYYLAMKELTEEEHLAGLAFRCWPDLPNIVGHWPYVALARHVSEGHAVAMEGDVDGALCSVIAENLGIGPVYMTDWLEHDLHTITIWHTGAAPLQLCEPVGGKRGPVVTVQFNNKKPAVVEATIRADMPVTIFRLWRCDDEYRMTALEGHTVKPRRHLLATNGLVEIDGEHVTEWFDDMLHEGMPHHVCVVPGHRRELLRRFARSLRLGWY